MMFKNFILIFIFSLFANYSFAKDLSGNAIDCIAIQDSIFGDQNTKFYTYSTIHFVSKNKARFAVSGFKKVGKKIELFDLLVPGDLVDYDVLDKKIVLKVNRIKNVYDPLGMWRRLLTLGFGNRKITKGQIWILRETLQVTNLAVYDGIKCELVDADDPELFHKYSEYTFTLEKLLQKEKEESESKNKL